MDDACACGTIETAPKTGFDHIDTRSVVAALQARQLPRWLVRGVARGALSSQEQNAHIGAEWVPEFDFCKGVKTGGVDTPALLNELLQHHISSLAEQWQCIAQATSLVVMGTTTR